MIIALISDVHGNLEALTAVLRDIHRSGAAEIWFLGDAVGYGANPNETLKLIQAECTVKLMGNHDYSALGLLDSGDFNDYAQSAIQFTSAILDSQSIGIMSAFKMKHEQHGVLAVHATPEAPEEWRYCLGVYEADRQFRHFRQRVAFLGHTHKPTVFSRDFAGEVTQYEPGDLQLESESRYLINSGSVGQPRDGDPRAAYALFDVRSQRMSHRRVEYDVATAQAKMAAAQLPEFLIERLANGK